MMVEGWEGSLLGWLCEVDELRWRWVTGTRRGGCVAVVVLLGRSLEGLDFFSGVAIAVVILAVVLVLEPAHWVVGRLA